LSKVVLNPSVMIALSTLGHFDKLVTIFKEILIAEAINKEICSVGGLVVERELHDIVGSNKIAVKSAKNRLIVNALLDH
jgi:predicted nucleic acid-binding protein